MRSGVGVSYSGLLTIAHVLTSRDGSFYLVGAEARRDSAVRDHIGSRFGAKGQSILSVASGPS